MRLNEKIGIKIRQTRLKKKQTIEDLALECSMSKNYLNDIELGRKNPTIEMLEKICNSLGIKIKDLFD